MDKNAWKQLALQMTILVLSMNPKTAPVVPFIGPAIGAAESMPGKSGAEKLAIAIQLAKTGMDATNALRPGTLNVVVADEVISSAISAVVDATNVFKKAGLIVNKPVVA